MSSNGHTESATKAEAILRSYASNLPEGYSGDFGDIAEFLSSDSEEEMTMENKSTAPTDGEDLAPDDENVVEPTSGNVSVLDVQKKLIKAGFDLPRFGADGLHGKETTNAIKSLLDKARNDGLYFGTGDGTIIDEIVMSLLDFYIENGSGNTLDTGSAVREGNRSSGVLYLGDSQMVGSLGNVLMRMNGAGVRVAKSGKTADWVASNQRVKEELRKKPSKIIISLNGNGTSGTRRLIELIQKESPDSHVVWTGAPPPIFMKGKRTWANYLKSEDSFGRAYDERAKRNNYVKAILPPSWLFIDPYEYIKYDEPLEIKGRTYPSGYTCDRCDGIHLPSSISSNYISRVSALS